MTFGRRANRIDILQISLFTMSGLVRMMKHGDGDQMPRRSNFESIACHRPISKQ